MSTVAVWKNLFIDVFYLKLGICPCLTMTPITVINPITANTIKIINRMPTMISFDDFIGYFFSLDILLNNTPTSTIARKKLEIKNIPQEAREWCGHNCMLKDEFTNANIK